jgi:hypothetical protein
LTVKPERDTAATDTGERYGDGDVFGFPRTLLLPLVLQRGNEVTPIYGGRELRKGDRVHFAVHAERAADANLWLAQHDWELIEYLDAEAPVRGIAEEQQTV